MLKIKSYIKRPEIIIKTLLDINENFEKIFIDINDENNITKIIKNIDENYIEGVIYFEYMGVAFMDFKYWDIIDSLWAYMINSIEECIINGQSEFYFPDQPIKVTIKTVSKDSLLLSVEAHEIIRLTLLKIDFFENVLNEGEKFLKKLQYYLGNRIAYSYELDKIDYLREKFNLEK